MSNQKPHIALILLELANIIQQGRSIFPISRFHSIDSSNEESVKYYRSQVLEMFSALPAIDLSEEQSLFIVETKSSTISLFEDSCFSTREVAIENISKVFPVTARGQHIFLATGRLPDVVLHDPIFEDIWHNYFWKYQGYLVAKGAYQLAKEFVVFEFPSSIALKWLTCLAEKLCSKNKSIKLDNYGELIYNIINSKRNVEDKYYNNESDIFVFYDFFKCFIEKEDKSTFAEKSREYCIKYSKDTRSLSELVTTIDFKSITEELKTIYGVSHDHDFIGLLLFLSIRLQKRDGKLRNLIDIKSKIDNQNDFTNDSIKLAILLIGLTAENPDEINEFLYRDKSSFGIFSKKLDSKNSACFIHKTENNISKNTNDTDISSKTHDKSIKDTKGTKRNKKKIIANQT